jgi:PIN domain nuclease of toxin-antitoxin system
VLLRDRVDPPRISAINLAEVLDVLARHQGWPAGEVEEKLRWLSLGGLQVVAVDEPVGLWAGRLHADHYDRARRPLSLADCAALATALARGQRLATSDPALIAAARAEGCAVVALPDTRGQRPAVGESTGVDG